MSKETFKRVAVTDGAKEIIDQLRDENGELMFHQSGGCCDRSQPMCLPINEFRLGKFITEYEAKIAQKIAFVMCGGNLTGQPVVSEQYLLDLEREGFLSLLGEPKTMERIQYMLENNKPLRN